jgi:hypothetical protein
MSRERNLGASVGPRFERGADGAIRFAFVVDAGTVVGPRPATAKDQAEHPGAWESFRQREGVEPLDRDAKGGAGGSLAKPEGAKRRPRKVANESPDDNSVGR